MMAEQEVESTCENCGSEYRLIFDDEQVSYNPDNCPFCGDLNEVIVEDLNRRMSVRLEKVNASLQNGWGAFIEFASHALTRARFSAEAWVRRLVLPLVGGLVSAGLLFFRPTQSSSGGSRRSERPEETIW
jgi:hypothetical protein